MNKKNVVILYGGRSTEHEVSLRSACFVLKNLNQHKYNIFAIGINHSGEWIPQNTNKMLTNIEKLDFLPIEYSENSQSENWMEENIAKALLPIIKTIKDGENEGKEETVVFPIIHGSYGEDGCLQGLLEMSSLPYVGADTLSSAICMDKVVAKELVKSVGINVVPYITFRRHEWDKRHTEIMLQIEQQFKSSVFIKPASLGSSIGASMVYANDLSSLVTAIEHAFQFDEKVIVEKFINAREIQFAALGDYDPEISEAGEINYGGSFYSYGTKYLNENFSQSEIPVNLPKTKVKEGQNICKKVFKVLQIYGLARIDLFLSKDDDKYYFNEANTIPGLTSVSQYAQLWKHHGVEHSHLMDRLIEIAISRKEQRKKLKRAYK
ncbi:MAG: D-alanine--D-alanine ligase [Oligoflexia bacterium]|nr:D-alanine--D-alanine ligase [Oligoflexia bacterium]